MSSLVDTNLIRQAAPYADWYLRIQAHYSWLQKQVQGNERLKEAVNEELRSLFEDLLDKKVLRLGGTMPKLDAARQPIDTIVIHHTSQQPGLRLERLNVIQLLNIYMPYYQNPTIKGEQDLKGHAMTSNHYYQNMMVFWGYHWLIRMDGTALRLLPDEAIGWHAGNWEVNCRSAGICLDNDYHANDPTDSVLQSCVSLIRKQYPQVSYAMIIGHREATKTECPGKNYWHWKRRLAAIMAAAA